MFQVESLSSVPVYEQIERQVKEFISVGIFSPGDMLPSVRSLSLDMSVNPNTIQRAFNELNILGITVSVPGKGVFVSQNAPQIMLNENKKKLVDLTNLTRELSVAGLSEDEVLDAVHKGLNKNSK